MAPDPDDTPRPGLDRPRQESPIDDYAAWKGWNAAEEFGTCDDFERAYFDAEIARLPLGAISNVLELGFGNGRFLGFARSKGWRIAGVEVIGSLRAAAKERGFEAMTPDDVVSLAPGSLDLVVAFDVIEHIDQAELPALFATVFDKLKPGGVFLARFPNGDSPLGLPYQHGDVTHVTVIGSAKLRYFARRAGLVPLYCGAPRRVVFTGYWRHTVQEMASAFVVRVLETFMRVFVVPRAKLTFFSPNLLAIMQRPGPERAR